MSLIAVIEEVFSRPPIPFRPEQQSLKGWITFCLRDRGFKVIYAQNADFAIESRTNGKIYFNVTEDATNLDGKVGWIVRNPDTDKITVIAPQD